MKKIFLFILMLTIYSNNYAFDTDHIVSDISNAIKGYDAQIGLSVIINRKDTLSYNNKVKYPMMSVFKFHQALAVTDYMQKHNIAIDSLIFIQEKDLRKDTYSPLRDKYPNGNINISIGKLLEYTLQESDNNACDILFKYILNIDSTEQYIKNLGISHFAIEYDEKEMHKDIQNCYKNWSTPLASTILLDMFVNERTIKNEYFEFVYNTMIHCETGQNRLTLPLKNKKLIIGHKTGTSDKNSQGQYIGINDIGFIRLDKNNYYVISVYIKDSKESYKTNEYIIAKLSKIIYEHVYRQIYKS